jgi:uncharacterized paraquat-inducible protein A
MLPTPTLCPHCTRDVSEVTGSYCPHCGAYLHAPEQRRKSRRNAFALAYCLIALVSASGSCRIFLLNLNAELGQYGKLGVMTGAPAVVFVVSAIAAFVWFLKSFSR